MRRLPCLLLISLVLVLQTITAHAQDAPWQELRTLQFSILYPDEARATAEQYAQFVDPIYEEMSTFWGYRTPPPVILRIYPTMELYYTANPMAENMPGVVAHAHLGRREISIAIPQTAGQSEEELRNNVRHELTHLIAADLSGGRLTTPWHEGIAQYVEHPSEQVELKMELMRRLITEGRLLSWRQINQPGAAYADPQIGYPQSYTIVAFLIQRNGVAQFRQFVEAMKQSSSYRGALESVYRVPSDVLEREWLEQLGAFVSEGYRTANAAGAGRTVIDLGAAEALLAGGNYTEAVSNLRTLLTALSESGDSETIQRAQSLLARAETGQLATQRGNDARAALIRGDYHAAREASEEGQRQFEAIGQDEQAAVVAEFGALAQRGLEAQAQMAEAGRRLRGLRVREAHALLISAYTTFTELGDQPRAGQAQTALSLISRGERTVAGACLVGGAILMVVSAGRRRNDRRLAVPYS